MAPDWAPTLSQVAIHIPTRTRPVNAATYAGEYEGTFTADTTPTATEAAEHIDQACIKVVGVVGSPVAEAAEDACRVAAAWWAAYSIEIGYPERDADVQVYEELRRQAEAALASAASVNAASGGGTTVTPEDGADLLPSHTFPDAPVHADLISFW